MMLLMETNGATVCWTVGLKSRIRIESHYFTASPQCVHLILRYHSCDHQPSALVLQYQESGVSPLSGSTAEMFNYSKPHQKTVNCENCDYIL